MASELLSRITVEPGKRSGKPCIRGLRITVSDVRGWDHYRLPRTDQRRHSGLFSVCGGTWAAASRVGGV